MVELLAGLFFLALGSYFGYGLGIQPLLPLLTCRTCSIREAKRQEAVYIAGMAGQSPELVSPLSSVSCIQWRVHVTETKRSGKSSQTITRLDLRSHEPYEVRDRSGTIMVETNPTPPSTISWGRFIINLPHLALDEVVGKGEPLYHDYQHLFHPFQQEASTAFLERRAIPLKQLMGLPRNLHIREYGLQSGHPIHVWGTVVEQKGKRWLRPSIVSRKSRPALLWASMGFGLLGLLVSLLGLKVIYEFGIR